MIATPIFVLCVSLLCPYVGNVYHTGKNACHSWHTQHNLVYLCVSQKCGEEHLTKTNECRSHYLFIIIDNICVINHITLYYHLFNSVFIDLIDGARIHALLPWIATYHKRLRARTSRVSSAALTLPSSSFFIVEFIVEVIVEVVVVDIVVGRRIHPRIRRRCHRSSSSTSSSNSSSLPS